MTHLQRTLAGLTLAGLLASSGCAAPDPNAGQLRADVAARTVAVADAAALPDVVATTRRIGLTTLAGAGEDGNVVVSPSSLAVALAMLTEGARGTSLAELEALLGAAGDERRDAFAALRGAFAGLDGDPAIVKQKELPERPLVHLADQVVVDDELDVNADFLAALADVFDAGVQHTDLGSAEGKRILDAWVNYNTGGLIEKSAITPEPALRLVLQDAILLAARWKVPFDQANTGQRPFTLPDGSQVDVETMASTEGFAVASVGGWQALRLPYTQDVHADLLLPPVGTGPATATPELLAEVAAALDNATPMPTDLTLPTLDITQTPLELLDTIATLGAPSVLCDSADTDLSGIGLTPGSLCVSQAFQQAVLKVDEEGTVAAAVTEIAVRETAGLLPGDALHFDRPFLFTVSHDATGWPLFLAAVRDPRH